MCCIYVLMIAIHVEFALHLCRKLMMTLNVRVLYEHHWSIRSRSIPMRTTRASWPVKYRMFRDGFLVLSNVSYRTPRERKRIGSKYYERVRTLVRTVVKVQHIKQPASTYTKTVRSSVDSLEERSNRNCRVSRVRHLGFTAAMYYP
jgi:hypothetical protein